MPDSQSALADLPWPDRVRTREDFARELTLLREVAGLTVRQVASKADAHAAHSTIGDWFAGRGLPSASLSELLVRVLQVCGVSDAGLVDQWLAAWRRVRRAPGPRAAGLEPYRGLSSFQAEDADWFFGRQALTAQLVDRLAGLRAAGGGVQVVVGASGSGKSSLLRAGLIPALRANAIPGSATWPVALSIPGPQPVDELAARLAAFAGVPAGEVAKALRADPGRCPGHLWRAVTAAGEGSGRSVAGTGPAGPPLVLVADQFEEVFTGCADDERRLFIDALCEAALGGALVVLGLRADFYAQALRYPQLVAAIQAGQLTVGPMSETQLREVIVEPARKAKADLEVGLVELLLRDVSPPGGAHEAGVLPLLSYALYSTWRQGHGRRMTIAGYRTVGGIHGAVAASAGKIYDELTEHQRELARRLFLSLVHIAADTADTRRRVSTTELLAGYGDTQAAEMEDVLDRFVAQRLITADTETVEISHEALLTAWPRLRVWLDTDRAGLVVGRRLADAAVTWRDEQCDPASLYRGTRLAAAKEWAETAGPAAILTPLAREFLNTSVQRQLAEERATGRRARRLRQLVAGLVVLFLLTATATVVAVNGLQNARDQRNTALSGKVANEAAALRATNPALAAQLSLAAYRLSPTPEARGSVLSTFATPYATQLTGHTATVYATEFSPDGRILATASDDHTVRLWDTKDPHHPKDIATLTGHSGTVSCVVFSPDGRTLATSSADHTVRLWDITDPRRAKTISVLTGHTDAIRRLAFSPDGHLLATASYDHTARLWDVIDPHHPSSLAVLIQGRDALAAAVFSPDGRTLATVGSGTTVRLWDVTDPRRPTALPDLTGHTDRVLDAAFSPDGHILATGSFDNTIRLWDVTDPHHPGPLATLTGHSNGVVAIAFSPDGHTLATGSYDDTVRLWNITDPRNASALLTLTGHADIVYSVAFSPDGATLASGSRDNTARLWDLHMPIVTDPSGGIHAVALSPDGRILATGSYRTARLWDVTDPGNLRPLAALIGHTDGVNGVAFSPDGHTLATASLDTTVRLWDVTGPRHPNPLATLTGHTDNVFTVAFSPDGRTLATGGADRTARLWDVTDRRQPRPLAILTGHTDNVNSVAFSPDGRTLATGGADRTARLWDVADPRRPRRIAVITGHSNNVIGTAFSPDGRTLATSSTDRTARLWDVTDLRHPRPLATLSGHANTVSSVAFSPDGHTLATAGFDNTVRLWDVTNPRHPGPPATLQGHTDMVNSVAFGLNGRIIVTGSDDATARFWEIDTSRTAQQICSLAYPPIDPFQWGQHFADLPYQPPCR